MSDFLSNFLASQNKGVLTPTGGKSQKQSRGVQDLASGITLAYSASGQKVPAHIAAASKELQDIYSRRAKYAGASAGAVGAMIRFGKYDPVADFEREQALSSQLMQDASAARGRAARVRKAQARAKKANIEAEAARLSGVDTAATAQNSYQQKKMNLSVGAEVELATTKATEAFSLGVPDAPTTTVSSKGTTTTVSAPQITTTGGGKLSFGDQAKATKAAQSYMYDLKRLGDNQQAVHLQHVEATVDHLDPQVFVDIAMGDEETKQRVMEISGATAAEIEKVTADRLGTKSKAMTEAKAIQAEFLSAEIDDVMEMDGMDPEQLAGLSPGQYNEAAQAIGVSRDAIAAAVTESRADLVARDEFVAKQEAKEEIVVDDMLKFASPADLQGLLASMDSGGSDFVEQFGLKISRAEVETKLGEKLERRAALAQVSAETNSVSTIARSQYAAVEETAGQLESLFGGTLPASVSTMIDGRRTLVTEAMRNPMGIDSKELANDQVNFIKAMDDVLKLSGIPDETRAGIHQQRFVAGGSDLPLTQTVIAAQNPTAPVSLGTKLVSDVIAEVAGSADFETIDEFIAEGMTGDVTRTNDKEIQSRIAKRSLQVMGTQAHNNFLQDPKLRKMLSPAEHNELATLLLTADNAVDGFEYVALYEQKLRLQSPEKDVGQITQRLGEIYANDEWFENMWPESRQGADLYTKELMLHYLGANTENMSFNKIDDALKSQMFKMAERAAQDGSTAAQEALAEARNEATMALSDSARRDFRKREDAAINDAFLSGGDLDSALSVAQRGPNYAEDHYQMTMDIYEGKLRAFTNDLLPPLN